MSDPRADQMRAAVSHAELALHRQRPAMGGQPQQPGFVAAFLTRLAQRHTEAIRANDGRLVCCQHIASGSPAAHVVAAWRPGTAMCLGCAEGDQSLLPADENENWTCDGCGEVKPGDVSLSVVQTEATLFYFGLCPACAAQYQRDIAAHQGGLGSEGIG